jgi:hypothetical protein
VRVLPVLLVATVVENPHEAVPPGGIIRPFVRVDVGRGDGRHGAARGVVPPICGDLDGVDVRLLDVLAEVVVPDPVSVRVA